MNTDTANNAPVLSEEAGIAAAAASESAEILNLLNGENEVQGESAGGCGCGGCGCGAEK